MSLPEKAVKGVIKGVAIVGGAIVTGIVAGGAALLGSERRTRKKAEKAALRKNNRGK